MKIFERPVNRDVIVKGREVVRKEKIRIKKKITLTAKLNNYYSYYRRLNTDFTDNPIVLGFRC